MADFDPRTSFESDPMLGEIRLEFCQGLAGRLETLRSSLARLTSGYDDDAAEMFVRAAHSLKGSSPSFGADEMATHAAALTERGRRWAAARRVSAEEIAAARAELRELASAADRFRAAVEAGRKVGGEG